MFVRSGGVRRWFSVVVVSLVGCAHADPIASRSLDGMKAALNAQADTAGACERYNAWLAGTDLLGRLVLADIQDEEDGQVYSLFPTPEGTLVLHGSGTSSAREQWADIVAAQGPLFELRLLRRFAEELDRRPFGVALRITAAGDSCWERRVSFGRDIDDIALTTAEREVCDGPYAYRHRLTEHLPIASATRSVDIPSGRVSLAAFETVLRRRFARGRIRVDAPSERILLMTVDKLRGEVLRDMDRWEKLELTVVALPSQVLLSVDAWYAPGIGRTAPAPSSYKDVETTYAAELETYTAALLTDLARATP